MSAKWTSAIKTQLEISTVLKANRQLTFLHIVPHFISSNMVSLHLSIKHQIHGFTLIKDVCVNRTIQYSSSPETYLLPRRHSYRRIDTSILMSLLLLLSTQSISAGPTASQRCWSLESMWPHPEWPTCLWMWLNITFDTWECLGRIIGCFVSVGIGIVLILLLPSLRTSASMTGSSLYKELPLLTCFPCAREAISSLTHLLWFDIRADTQKQTHPENGHVNDYNFFTTLIDTCTQ